MEKTTAFQGSIPAKYDQYLGPFLFEPYALDIVSRLKDKKYEHILEIACGTGRVTNHLSVSVDHDSLTATDLNPDMIEIAKKRVLDDKIKWQAADALELPFDDNSFDLVVIQFGIMFFPDKLKGLQEVYRVLKSGGKSIYNTWDRVDNNPAIHTGRQIIESYFDNNPPMFYNIPFSMHDELELKVLTEQAGFKDVDVSFVEKDASCDSAADLTIGIVEGNPIHIAITEKDPSLVDIIKKEVQKALIEKFGELINCKIHAWVVEAKK